jgi:hypothetical protein
MEQNWMKEYDHAIYITWPQLRSPDHVEYTRQCAEYLNWQFEDMEGDYTLAQDLLEGRWERDDILVVPPRQTIVPTYDELIIGCEP